MVRDERSYALRQLIPSLGVVQERIIEAADDMMVFHCKHPYDFRVSLKSETLQRLRDICGDQLAETEHLDQILSCIEDQVIFQEKAWDEVVTFIVKAMRSNTRENHYWWKEWYDMMERCEHLSDGLATFLRGVDRILNVLHNYVGRAGKRKELVPDYIDTLNAIAAISGNGGKYAPLTEEHVQHMKSELRRRRQAKEITERINIGMIDESNNPEPSNISVQNGKPYPITTQLPTKWNQTVTSTIAVIFLCILAAIPGYVGWKYASNQPGTSTSADFWFLVQGSTMSIIGVATIVTPLWLTGALFPQQWVWMWLLVFVSVACPVAAIFLFLYVSSAWSATVSYVGSAAQAVITMQALFMVKKVKMS